MLHRIKHFWSPGWNKRDSPATQEFHLDKNGKMNYSLMDTHGSVLVISQFTLGADTSRGNRPGFSGAASPEEGAQLYQHFCRTLSEFGILTKLGKFGETMRVKLTNEGPVTVWLDTEKG